MLKKKKTVSISSGVNNDRNDDELSDHELDDEYNLKINNDDGDDDNSQPLSISHHLVSTTALEELNDIDDDDNNNGEQSSPSSSPNVENNKNQEEDEKKTANPITAVTPLPWGKLFVVFFLYLCDSLSFTSLFPYITFMIADFKLTDNPTEYGYYVGVVAAAYFFSQFVSSFFWGTISDSLGRRPVLLFGTFFGALSVILFGFSKWLWWACICRFLFGLLNGNLGVVKSYLGEITDSTNQARAFSLTSITFGLSSVIGPLLGGVFTRPYQQYPNFVLLFPEWIQKIVIEFPFLLPNLFISSFSVIGFVLGYLKLEEVNKNSWYYRKFIKKEQLEISNGKDASSKKGEGLGISTGAQQLEEEQEQEPIVVNNISLFQKFKNKFNSFRKNEMLASPVPLTTCLLYLLLGSKQIMFDECLPLYAVMPKDQGGLGMSSYNLGLLGGFLGFIIFFNQLFITPHIIAKFSPLTCYRWSIVVDTVFNIVFPEIIWLVAGEDDPLWRHVLFWSVLGFILLIRQVSNGYTFLGTFLITNNSVSRKNYGKLNGTAQSFVALSRMISPIAGGAIFASSVAVSKFPIDHRLVFYVITGISIVMFFLSLILNKSINKPKEENKTAPKVESTQVVDAE